MGMLLWVLGAWVVGGTLLAFLVGALFERLGDLAGHATLDPDLDVEIGVLFRSDEADEILLGHAGPHAAAA